MGIVLLMKEIKITQEQLEQALLASNLQLKQEIINELRLLNDRPAQVVEMSTDIELDSRLTAIEQDIQAIKDNMLTLTNQMNLYFGRAQDVRY